MRSNFGMQVTHTPRTRLVIADDHELARSGLRAMLDGAEDLAVVGEATDGVEAVALCQQLRPDLVLLDVRMPRLDGLGAARAIRDSLPQTRIVMVTLHESLAYLDEALLAGASGYILKDATRDALLSALRVAVAGDSFLHTALASRLQHRRVAGNLHSSRASTPLQALTARETQVLSLITEGLTNNQIANTLGIAPGTAKIHVERVIGKMGVADRTQAAVRAVESGLIDRSLP